MDKYYGNVCELDIIFNFQKAYFILDELLLAGEMQESSKKNVLRCISQEDSLEDMEVSGNVSPCRRQLYTSRTSSFPELLHHALSLSRLILCVCLSGRGRSHQNWVKRLALVVASLSSWSSSGMNVVALISGFLVYQISTQLVQISNHSSCWILAGLTYLSITGSRNKTQGVRDLDWLACLGVRMAFGDNGRYPKLYSLPRGTLQVVDPIQEGTVYHSAPRTDDNEYRAFHLAHS
jgi:Clathrin adaptor complex small chain